MRKELKDEIFKLIVIDFGKGLTRYEYNQYVIKLRNYFVDYLSETKYTCNTVEELFKYEFTRKDIIDSTLYYIINNPKVSSKSAIDDFLIALNRLFDETINKKYFNQNIANIRPFTNMSKDVENILESNGNKKLKDRVVNPTITKVEYDFIIEYLRTYNPRKLIHYEYKIIVSLFLLYGFSLDKIIELDVNDYSTENGVLSIIYNKTEKEYIELELPYKLKNLFDSFIEIRKSQFKEVKNMFVNSNGKKISSSFIYEFLEKIRESFYGNDLNTYNGKFMNKFTTTGLSKYGVIEMILEGMNQSIILDLTGQGPDIYSDCQDIVNEMKNLNRNRYINHMIRGIATYDDI